MTLKIQFFTASLFENNENDTFFIKCNKMTRRDVLTHKHIWIKIIMYIINKRSGTFETNFINHYDYGNDGFNEYQRICCCLSRA